MIVRVTLKDPDTLYDAINDAVDECPIEQVHNVTAEEAESIREIRKERIRELSQKWFEYGEYVTLIIDTDKETCTVENR